MGRRARLFLPLPDGRTIGVSFKLRGGIFRVQFPHPTEKGKYVEASTGVYDEAGETEAYRASAQIVLRHYTPTLPPDLRKATWEDIVQHLTENTQLRPRSLDVYTSAIRILRDTVDTRGPHDVDKAKAESFRVKYAKGKYTRSNKPNAKQYPRQAKTVENALRRLSSLWGKYLVKKGYVTSNPWEHVERPTIPEVHPTAPTEADIDHFLNWVNTKYAGWEMLRAFIDTKCIAVCRLLDLCGVLSKDLDTRKRTLTIQPVEDKTHKQKVVPLPPDLFETLNRIKGPVYLWESYTETARIYRKGRRNKATFEPGTLYWAVLDVFEKYNAAHPERRPLKSHDLRRRGITLLVEATGSLDKAAELAMIHPTTARKHYTDKEKAFNLTETRRQMIDVLRPKTAPESTPE